MFCYRNRSLFIFIFKFEFFEVCSMLMFKQYTKGPFWEFKYVLGTIENTRIEIIMNGVSLHDMPNLVAKPNVSTTIHDTQNSLKPSRMLHCGSDNSDKVVISDSKTVGRQPMDHFGL